MNKAPTKQRICQLIKIWNYSTPPKCAYIYIYIQSKFRDLILFRKRDNKSHKRCLLFFPSYIHIHYTKIQTLVSTHCDPLKNAKINISLFFINLFLSQRKGSDKKTTTMEALSFRKIVLMVMMISATMMGSMAKSEMAYVGGGKSSWAPNVNLTEWSIHEQFHVGEWLCKSLLFFCY